MRNDEELRKIIERATRGHATAEISLLWPHEAAAVRHGWPQLARSVRSIRTDLGKPGIN